MKTLVFKTAWRLVKELGYTLSEALKISWNAIKNNVCVVINKAWNGKKVLTFGFVCKQFSVFGSNVASVLEKKSSYVKPNQECARFDYGKGMYNGD